LVTAGVYLLIRFSSSFGYWLNIILWLVSGLTIFMAGLGANFEFDLRRIIVLSALSQLGLMIITISIGFCDHHKFRDGQLTIDDNLLPLKKNLIAVAKRRL
jgi:NADH:ubiquinone oxidoreductase subunit 5 (subunit L)/multisubunit Na+/H+ antiporter MnhA subunit